MNINITMLLLSMRLSKLGCWIQQYLYVMSTVPTAESNVLYEDN